MVKETKFYGKSVLIIFTAATAGDHADFRPLTFYRSTAQIFIFASLRIMACATSDSGVEGVDPK